MSKFRSWTNAILFSGAAAQGAVQASGDLDTYLRTLISTRRQHPQQDLLSRLTTADEDGAGLSDTEILAMAFLLLIAGHETTVNLIGNTMLTLLTAQDRYKRLRERPEQLPAALEEHLRHLGPVHIATIRFTTEPLALGGTPIEADELIFVSLTAANSDPHRFPHPDTVDYQRQPGGHLAFGHGIHVCLGAPLARAEATIAITRLLCRYPNMRLATDSDRFQWRTSTLIRGLETLPVQSANAAQVRTDAARWSSRWRVIPHGAPCYGFAGIIAVLLRRSCSSGRRRGTTRPPRRLLVRVAVPSRHHLPRGGAPRPRT